MLYGSQKHTRCVPQPSVRSWVGRVGRRARHEGGHGRRQPTVRFGPRRRWVGLCNPRPPAGVVTGHAMEQAAVLVAPLGPRPLGHPSARTRHGRCAPLARAAAPRSPTHAGGLWVCRASGGAAWPWRSPGSHLASQPEPCHHVSLLPQQLVDVPHAQPLTHQPMRHGVPL